VAGPTSRVKLTQVLPHGVRIEVKLDRPGPATIALELSATMSYPSSAGITR
jgi:hypothetical protein